MDAMWAEFSRALELCARASSASKNMHWTEYMSALTTPMLAIFGAFIAYRQWATSRDELRLDLFERRLVIYEAFRSALGQMYVKGQLNHEDEDKYLAGVAGSLWLFGDDVHKYLVEEFWNKLMEHRLLVSQLQEALQIDERRELAQKKRELREWLLAQNKRSEKLFLPYLGFHHRTAGKRKW
jgi:hypothetical protein